SINAIDPVRYLADGRPVFGSARLDPRFDFIQMAESAGNSQYDAFSLQLRKRFSDGILFSANYTLSRAIDDAPEQNVATGGAQIVISDPTDRGRDKGRSLSDQRHTFSMSFVANPRFEIGNRLFNSVLNNNQIGLIVAANSGERFNIVADTDLNRDGSPASQGIQVSDRPVGIKRNAGKTPPQLNIDLRFSRLIRLNERFRIEAFADFINVFNINSITGYTDPSVPVDTWTGELTGPLPDFKARDRSTAQESRQVQLGFKFHF
ncbi:MAG TPA: hypothetical protein VJL58_11110, partial [Pyrinomonadaceae bacterium]|nr:hypothetical protein [Pyrinomonadaceae bacterium]